jgi:hypothetical protein
MQLMHELYEDITLEKQLLGDRAHRVIRDIDLQIPALKAKQKHKLVHDLEEKVRKLWEPLKQIQVRVVCERISFKLPSMIEAHAQYLNCLTHVVCRRNNGLLARFRGCSSSTTKISTTSGRMPNGENISRERAWTTDLSTLHEAED